MKTLIEHMITMMIMIIMIFIFSSLLMIELQIINARNYHTNIIEQVQNIGSYDNEIFNEYKMLHNSDKLQIINDGESVKVIYDFTIKTPFFGDIKDNRLIGWAR